MSEKHPIYIKFQIDKIEFGYRAYYKKNEAGTITWFIPGYNIRFNSKDMETGEKRAKKMIRYFTYYWNKKGSFREFLLEIHRLGFRAPKHHDLTLSRVIKKEVREAKFVSPVLHPKISGYQSKYLVIEEAA